MALSLDDKLLGEKTHYYCSSSEDEGEEEDDDNADSRGKSNKQEEGSSLAEPDIHNYQGYCTNTGPKGVITDWREYKKLETEKREHQEKEKLELAKKLCFTCKSQTDDDKTGEGNGLPESLLEELEDEFLKEYRRKRIEEMKRSLQRVPQFGKLIHLKSRKEYLDAIDKEDPQVTIVVHIYEDGVAACDAMNGCLMCLAQEYPTVKFCNMKASTAMMSFKFTENGIPALLVYKSGLLIGNFIRMTDEFGEDFFATELESFLQEHGFLPSLQKELNDVIRDKHSGNLRSSQTQDDDSGSDFDID